MSDACTSITKEGRDMKKIGFVLIALMLLVLAYSI